MDSKQLRSMALVVSGMVAGALFVGPVVAQGTPRGSAPAAIQTRVASCQGLNFHAINSTTQFDYRNDVGELLVRDDSGAANDRDGYFLCDPHLPHRAVVTKVQFTLRDDTSYAEVRYCALYRAGLTASNANEAPQLMAQVATTGMAGQPGVVRNGTTSISFATVDNAARGYWLQCQINVQAGVATQGAGIHGASVSYRIDSANG